MPGRPTILKKIVGRTVLAVGAVGGVSTIISHYFSLFISTEILLKGPLTLSVPDVISGRGDVGLITLVDVYFAKITLRV